MSLFNFNFATLGLDQNTRNIVGIMLAACLMMIAAYFFMCGIAKVIRARLGLR